MPTVRRIVRDAAVSDYRFSAIVQAVVRSDQFRMRRIRCIAVRTASGHAVAADLQVRGIEESDGMFIFKKQVSRRTVLKGVGATIALPLLDAMNPAATAWAQTPPGRRRRGSPSSAFLTAPS
jgi:hypothetical protein